jgi:filamentous hemagglutinin
MIDPRKLTHYALDPDSLHGRHKAILFEKLLGFTKENHAELMRQLEQRCLHAEATLRSVDELGQTAQSSSHW